MNNLTYTWILVVHRWTLVETYVLEGRTSELFSLKFFYVSFKSIAQYIFFLFAPEIRTFNPTNPENNQSNPTKISPTTKQIQKALVIQWRNSTSTVVPSYKTVRPMPNTYLSFQRILKAFLFSFEQIYRLSRLVRVIKLSS